MAGMSSVCVCARARVGHVGRWPGRAGSVAVRACVWPLSGHCLGMVRLGYGHYLGRVQIACVRALLGGVRAGAHPSGGSRTSS